jgi:hypothetical protein
MPTEVEDDAFCDRIRNMTQRQLQLLWRWVYLLWLAAEKERPGGVARNEADADRDE